jgi:hypothetical protein
LRRNGLETQEVERQRKVFQKRLKESKRLIENLYNEVANFELIKPSEERRAQISKAIEVNENDAAVYQNELNNLDKPAQ